MPKQNNDDILILSKIILINILLLLYNFKVIIQFQNLIDNYKLLYEMDYVLLFFIL